MQLTLKYHGDLVEYFPNRNEDNEARVDVNSDDTVFSIIGKFNIPPEKINLVLVNGIKLGHAECETYHFSDGDTLAVWPVAE